MIGIALLSFWTLPFALSSPSANAGLRDQIYETTLPNGLKIILLENHKAPVATFQVWYRVGSRNESWGKTGLSHMLEHMMFKGTRGISGQTFTRIIEEAGGNDNAFTSKDYTAYFESMSAEQIHVAIELEADRMHNLLLRGQDFETERMVVMEERRLRTEDDPQAYLDEQLAATAFQIHPYRWPIIGWMQDLKALSLEDLNTYYRTYYSPANALVIAAGDFKKAEILTKIEKAFGSIPRGPSPNQTKPLEDPQLGERRIQVNREVQLPFILMGYHVPNLKTPDSYVLEVISAILAQGRSSRLYERLVREKKLVQSASADHDLLSRDPSLFLVSAEPLPGKDVAEVEKALNHEIQQLSEKPVPAEELEKAKNQLEAAFVFSQDSLVRQAMVLAQFEIVWDWRKIDDYVPQVRTVTPDDITRVAKQHLVPENRTVGILVPVPPRDDGKSVPTGASVGKEAVR
ncbi:MAG: Peptidase M16 inactive domain protein [Syntrophorhabdus sp. PtaU1.Bin002]|nr:MAG: Peptidase M16 inactive domain protein [Syntrophorhabdus sp. PtaU1.Bin002]